jgi:GTP-binding protein HflX
MKGYYRQLGYENVIFVSATQKDNMDGLKRMMFEEIKKRHVMIYPNYLKDGYEFMPDFTKAVQEEE